MLDLVGFAPGVGFLTSAVAAAVLLAIDARGLVTLNGLIRWKRMNGRERLVVAFLEVALFQFVVFAYLTQRFFLMAKDAFRSAVFARRPARTAVHADVDARSLAAPVDAEAIKRSLDDALSRARRGLPHDLAERVSALVMAIVDTLPAYRASGLAPHDRFAVERTACDYLPSALTSYLRLPVAFRSNPLPEADGKTPSQVLSDQLDLLIRRIREVTDMTYRKDVEALLVHGRFLQSKFGRSSLTLDP